MAEAGATLTGGCFCGAVRFEATGEVRMRGQCLCATCQKVSGGGGNFFLGMMASGFRYTQGAPRSYQAHEAAPIRDCCETCGVHLAARSPRAPDGIIVKVGALDDPGAFNRPDFVVWTEDMQPFHALLENVPAYPRFPRPA